MYSRVRNERGPGRDSGPVLLREASVILSDQIKEKVSVLIRESLAARISKDVPLESVSGLDEAVRELSDSITSLTTNRIQIRSCPKCGLVFATMNPNQWFCCHECSKTYGKSQFKSKLESDEALSCYSKAYKAMAARLRRGSISQEDMTSWKESARKELESLRAGKTSFEEFHRTVTSGIRRWERFEEAS